MNPSKLAILVSCVSLLLGAGTLWFFQLNKDLKQSLQERSGALRNTGDVLDVKRQLDQAEKERRRFLALQNELPVMRDDVGELQNRLESMEASVAAHREKQAELEEELKRKYQRELEEIQEDKLTVLDDIQHLKAVRKWEQNVKQAESGDAVTRYADLEPGLKIMLQFQRARWRLIQGKANTQENRNHALRKAYQETRPLMESEPGKMIQEHMSFFRSHKVDYSQVENPSAVLIYQSRVPDPEGTMVDVYLDGRIEYH